MLDTDRLRLREFQEDDAAAFYRLGSDPDIIRFTGDPGSGFRDLDHAREILISHPLRDYSVHGYGRWACIHRESGELIGFAGLKFLDDLKAVDIGYRFVPGYWGRGLATEATRPILDYGFEELGLEEVIGLVMPTNLASVRVLEKIGMVPEGSVEYGGEQVIRYVARRPSA